MCINVLIRWNLFVKQINLMLESVAKWPYPPREYSVKSSVEFAPLRKKSLSQQIAERIHESIRTGELQADDRLPTEGELAERFQVSRPTVREALKRLAAQNLIHSRRGPTGGTFVARPQLSDVSEQLTSLSTLLVGMGTFSSADIIEARSALEQLCCRLAAAKMTTDGHQAMVAALERQEDDTSSAEAFCAADVDFHRALADATGNPLIQLIMHLVIEALQPVSNMVTVRYRDRTTVIAEHRQLLAYLSSGHSTEACALVHQQALRLGQQMEQARQDRR